MIYPWAVPGAKVQCVSNEDWNENFVLPVVGRVYTIRSVEEAQYLSGLTDIALRLFEIEDQETQDGNIIVFPADHFKPLQQRPSDISIFTAMLTPRREVVDA